MAVSRLDEWHEMEEAVPRLVQQNVVDGLATLAQFESLPASAGDFVMSRLGTSLPGGSFGIYATTTRGIVTVGPGKPRDGWALIP